MNCEILNDYLESTIEYYIVDIEIDGKTLNIRVTVEDNRVQSHIETYKTDLWNSLTIEQKFKIDDVINEHF